MLHRYFLRGLTALLPLLPLGAALAQTPGAVPVAAYQFAASNRAYVPLPATATAVPAVEADDVASAPLPLGFVFEFGGGSYASVVASSNGFLSFAPGPVSSSLSNSLGGLPANTHLRPAVAPFWDDLTGQPRPAGPAPRAAYETTGVAPFRVFVFEWSNWGRFPSGGAAVFSMQARLYEGSNVVEFAYRPEASVAGTAGQASGSIGLAGLAAGDFLALNSFGAAPTASWQTDNANILLPPLSGQLYRFVPPGAGACYPITGLTTSGTTQTTAQLNFAASAASSSFRVTYRVAGSGGAATVVSPDPTAVPVVLTGLLPGTTYQATVQALCGSTAANAATVTFATAPTNDDPAGAAVLAVGSTCAATAGTLAGATPTPAALFTGPQRCSGPGVLDVWYRFQTGPVGSASATTVRVAASGAWGSLRLLGSGSGTASGPFTELSCNYAPINALDFTNLTPATTYFLTLGRSSPIAPDSLARFGLCLTPGPACALPTGLAVSNITASSAQLTLLPSTGNTGFAVTYYPQLLPAARRTLNTATWPLTLPNLLDNTTYIVQVQTQCGGANFGNPLTLGFRTLGLLPLPANDEPAAAVLLPLGSTCAATAATTVGATSNAALGTGNCNTSTGTPRDVWFAFQTAAAPALQNVQVAVTGRAAGQVQVYDNPIGGFVRLGCSTGGGPNRPAAPLLVNGLLANQRYLISVSGYTAADTTGAFGICVTAAPTPATPANNDCAAAAPLPVGSTCVPTAATTVGATPSAAPALPPLSCGSASGADVWFSLVVPAGGSLTLATSVAAAGTPNRLTDTVLEVFDGSCGGLRLLGCNDDWYGSLFARLALTGLVPGTPLLVRARGYGLSVGSFGICATAGSPRPCAALTGLAVVPLSATSVQVSFGLSVGNGLVRLAYAPAAGGPWQYSYAAVSPVVLSGLLPNTTYNLSVFTSCDSLGSAVPVLAGPVSTTFLSRPAGALATAPALALAAQVAVFPNPAHTAFTLSLPAALTARPGMATLCNALGQILLRREWPAQATALALPFDVGHLAAGLYWLRLDTSAGPVLKRVAVE